MAQLVSIPGLNIQQPWAELILSGKKIVETRYYPLPEKHLGHPLALIETPGPKGRLKARIVGVIAFESIAEYKSKREFESGFSEHLVDSNDPHLGWRPGRTKWAWRIKYAKRLTPALNAPYPRGIVFCSGCEVPAKLLSDVFL